jgi:outer membrane protein
MKRTALALLAMLPSWTVAHAQQNRDLRVRVGVGAQARPTFTGADTHRISPYGKIDIAHGTEAFRFKAPDDSFGIAVISRHGFSAGPALNLGRSRKDSDVGAPVGKIPATVEVGGFAQYEIGTSGRVRAELRKGLGGHNGIVGAVGVDKIWRDGDRYVFSIGPRILFSDAQYQRAYFGVTPAASTASGLPVYTPHGGIHAAALVSGLSYQFTPRFGLFGYARYARLVGDAAKSPIIRQFGSRNQVSGGIGLSYTFILPR